MNDATTGSEARWPLLVALAGPTSWLIVALITWMASRGPDGGWSGMAAMFLGLAVVLIIHIASPIILIILVVTRKRKRINTGATPAWGLAYYGLVALLALLHQGPSEFMRDATALLQVFGGK